jgi:NADPH:quinone reductase-like Zn-dependent oxidoreductase
LLRQSYDRRQRIKAIVIDAYGGAERLTLRELPDPKPGTGELLVKVRAAGVNPVDWKIRRGDLKLFLWLSFPYVPGGDVAGEVVEVGPGVSQFKPGDAVVAFVDTKRGGGYAELAVVKESAAALKGESLSFVEAASLPIAACTALQGLRDHGKLRERGTALINGAAGGVGHFGVQIAKVLGATTTATCGSANVEFVKSLGADCVIDYSREDFTQGAPGYDVVFDAVAMSSFEACRQVLKPAGAYITTLPSPSALLRGPLQSIAGLFGPAKQAKFIWVRPEGRDLAYLGQLADSGRLRPTVSQTFRLDQARAAQEASQQGHTRGKIVLEV